MQFGSTNNSVLFAWGASVFRMAVIESRDTGNRE